MKPIFVAEVSSNHNRDLDRCLAFIDAAASIGCQAVKFQLFKINDLFASEILQKSEEHRKREQWELPLDFLPVLAKHCHEKGLQFTCTPFYLKGVQELLPYVDFYKIASYELLWNDLLITCAETQKPVILSTGMATLDEVKSAVGIIRDAGCTDLTLLHCVSSYPTSHDECNLAAIETLRQTFKCQAGWSDHSVNPSVIYRAVHRWSATTVEFHLDIDAKGEEYKAGHCWLPHQIEPVIRIIRQGLETDGTGEKIPGPGESTDRAWRADPSDGLRPLLKTREQWRD